MKTIYEKIDSDEERECISDVGKIVSMKNWEHFDMDGGYAEFQTHEIQFKATAKCNAVLAFGCTRIQADKGEYTFCSDPRVIMMYLWRARQYFFDEPETDPPIPTREEAIAWMKEMDIPLEPQAVPREPTPKMKRNFFNRKD